MQCERRSALRSRSGRGEWLERLGVRRDLRDSGPPSLLGAGPPIPALTLGGMVGRLSRNKTLTPIVSVSARRGSRLSTARGVCSRRGRGVDGTMSSVRRSVNLKPASERLLVLPPTLLRLHARVCASRDMATLDPDVEGAGKAGVHRLYAGRALRTSLVIAVRKP